MITDHGRIADGDRAVAAAPSSPSVSPVPASIPCAHQFVYGGLRYAHGVNNRPGSGAKQTYYGHAYFCEKCLSARVEAVSTDRNSYQDALPGSSPATTAEAELLIPEYDRQWARQW